MGGRGEGREALGCDSAVLEEPRPNTRFLLSEWSQRSRAPHALSILIRSRITETLGSAVTLQVEIVTGGKDEDPEELRRECIKVSSIKFILRYFIIKYIILIIF